MTALATDGRRRLRRPSDAIVLPLVLLLLVTAITVSIAVGPRTLSVDELITALTAPTGTEADLIVRDVRLPRTFIGIAAGAALAVAGVIMQTLTRNPLAEPGLLGVNAGASFAVAIAIVVLGIGDFASTMWFAFLGAALASALVAVIGGVGRRASIGRLALTGVAIGAVLSAGTSALSLIDPHAYQAMRLWGAGALGGRSLEAATLTLVIVAVGLIVVVLIAPGLGLLALGEDTARALGGRVGIARLGGFLAIVILCGAATAAAGPIAFVGLLVPHALRAVFGPDTRRLLVYSALAGPILLLFADVLGAVVIAPRSIPVGVMTAFLGAPVLVALVLSRRVQADGAPS
ncbi:iron ABC transporter permease [Microbacterium sp. EST19A]|uniref:FecCD family ABC transporter permease n=1 Tax=Microbacterium sp. EST19A TaxID=2862681 RepID=UPI001CBB24BB|nr:iron ABC transporter permease [Microbacterium sp. EST19A]